MASLRTHKTFQVHQRGKEMRIKVSLETEKELMRKVYMEGKRRQIAAVCRVKPVVEPVTYRKRFSPNLLSWEMMWRKI